MSSPLQIFARKKRGGIPLSMISLYDAPSAELACDAGADAILVGDSMGNVILGYDSTIPVTMEAMKHHTGAVVRGVKASTRTTVPVVADLPFGSYASPDQAVGNAVALMQCGAHAIKIEGVQEAVMVALAKSGIPVMGHLGFTPQSVLKFEAVVQGRTAESARLLQQEARILEELGCFGAVLEATTSQLAQAITRELTISIIGIGAGSGCDGQVLVWNDLVGLSPSTFRFVKQWGNTRELWLEAAKGFVSEVESGAFPTSENGWNMTNEEVFKWGYGPTEQSEKEISPLDEQPF